MVEFQLVLECEQKFNREEESKRGVDYVIRVYGFDKYVGFLLWR